MTEDRYAPLRQVMTTAGVDAVALVPGSNFRRVFAKSFHINERSLVVVVPKSGAPAAVVPSLEAASFELIGFEGAVHLWRDHDGPGDAFIVLGRDMACNGACERIGGYLETLGAKSPAIHWHLTGLRVNVLERLCCIDRLRSHRIADRPCGGEGAKHRICQTLCRCCAADDDPQWQIPWRPPSR